MSNVKLINVSFRLYIKAMWREEGKVGFGGDGGEGKERKGKEREGTGRELKIIGKGSGEDVD